MLNDIPLSRLEFLLAHDPCFVTNTARVIKWIFVSLVLTTFLARYEAIAISSLPWVFLTCRFFLVLSLARLKNRETSRLESTRLGQTFVLTAIHRFWAHSLRAFTLLAGLIDIEQLQRISRADVFPVDMNHRRKDYF